MKLIVGLGNPGIKYELTRHNVGFLAMRELARQQDLGEWQLKDKFKAYVHEIGEGDDKLILAMPHTYMNNSGESVQAIKQFYKLDNADITVIHDDVDLRFGDVREKDGGGTAGHNGLESIVAHIGVDFKRIRIGIRNPIADLADTSDFVLAQFSKVEQDNLPMIIKRALDSINGEK